MTGTAGCREIRQALGVYVLGAIEPAERSTVEEHLATCPDCREELAALAGLPALLRRVPIAEAERLASADSGDTAEQPSDELLTSLLARAAGVKRARRWRGLAAAAAVIVLAVAGGAGVARFLPSAAPAAASHWQTVATVDQRTGTHMTVKYERMGWGTLMTVQVWGPRPGITCEFKVTDAAGHTRMAGEWVLSYHGGPVWYAASTSVPEPSVRGFQLTSGGHVLASVSAT
jgi:Putative zinc-finger